MKETPDILFLCNKKACGRVCPNGECRHTTNPKFSKNFTPIDGPNGLAYKEGRTKDIVYYISQLISMTIGFGMIVVIVSLVVTFLQWLVA